MAGSVLEWCAGWYDEEKNGLRVLRGGSWINKPEDLCVSYRGRYYAGTRDYSFLGIRLAQDIL